MVAYRRVVAGTSLLAAPACGLAWSLMQAPFTGYPAEVAFIAEHPNRWIASTHPFQGGFIPRLARRRAVEMWWFRRPLFFLGCGFFGPRFVLGYRASFTR